MLDITAWIGNKLVVQRRQRWIADCERLAEEAIEQMRAPLTQVDDVRCEAVGMQAQPRTFTDGSRRCSATPSTSAPSGGLAATRPE